MEFPDLSQSNKEKNVEVCLCKFDFWDVKREKAQRKHIHSNMMTQLTDARYPQIPQQ